MVHTWQHLKFASDAFHYMAEVIADLEIELKKQKIDTSGLPEPTEAPIPDGGNPCMPPNHCLPWPRAVQEYNGRLAAYMAGVFERTNALLTLAINSKVEAFPSRIIDVPEQPEPIEPLGPKSK